MFQGEYERLLIMRLMASQCNIVSQKWLHYAYLWEDKKFSWNINKREDQKLAIGNM